MSKYTVRELILYLLDFNMEAPVFLNGLYEESEEIYISWTGGDSDNVNESKKLCECVFLETDGQCENKG